jgi:hypothetical protein
MPPWVCNVEILLFVNNCATCLLGASFMMNVKVVYYLPDCTIMLHPLDLGIIQCFRQFLHEALYFRVYA